MSPTVLQSGPYRSFFFASDRGERQHVHVGRDDKACKFWLDPVAMAYNHGFTKRELRTIERLVREHTAQLIEAWNAYFIDKGGSGKGAKRQRH